MEQIQRFCFGAPREGFVLVEASHLMEADAYGFRLFLDEDNRPLSQIQAGSTGVCSSRADVPLQFEALVKEPGVYRVTVTLQGGNADGRVTLFSTHRRFHLIDCPVKQGEQKVVSFSVNVCDVQPNELPLVKEDRVCIGILGENAVLSAVEIEKAAGVTVFVAGDSTVTDQSANYPYCPKTSYCGWGQMLSQWFLPGVAISNHAQSGLTTDTFRNDLHWKVALANMKPGDFCLFQFGHNDQKCDELQAFGGYLDNLRRYVGECREHGVQPILCSPINRILFEENGALRDLLGEYGEAVQTVAQEEGIPFIDLLSQTTAIFTDFGPEKAPSFFWNDGKSVDRTHPNDLGGALISRLVASEIVRQGITPLCGFIREDFVPYEVPACKIRPVQSAGGSTSFLLNDQIKINTATVTDLAGCPQKAAVLELLAKGVLSPVSPGVFSPDAPLSLKDAATAMLRSLGLPGEGVEDAKARDLLPFDGENSEPVTREQLAALLVSTYNLRAPDKAIIGSVSHYPDRAQISPWALDFVRAADEMKFMGPEDESGAFAPKNPVTRAQAAGYLRKMMATR